MLAILQKILTKIDSLLTRHRVVAYSRTMLVSFIVFIILFSITGHIDKRVILQGDFMAFYTAGVIASDYYNQNNNNLYDLELQMEVQQKSGIIKPGEAPTIFLNPPLYAWLMVPFSKFSYLTAFNLWRLLSILLATISVIIFTKNLNVNVPWWDSLLLFLVSMPGFAVVFDGQNSFFFLSLYAISFLFLTKRCDFAAGLILGFGTLKPQLFFFIPFVLMFQKKWTALLGFIAGGIVVFVSSVLLVGLEGFANYLKVFGSDLYLLGIQTQTAKMYSVPAFIRLLLGDINANLLAILTASVLLIVVGYYSLLRRYKFIIPDIFALSILGALIAAPHLFYYDLSLLLLPFFVVYSWTKLENTELTEGSNYRLLLLMLYISLWVSSLVTGIIKVQFVTLILVFLFMAILVKTKIIASDL